MRKKLLVILSILSLLSQGLAAKPVPVDLSHPTPTNAAVRSAILPGWGQVFNGQDKKGYIIAGSVLLTAGVAYYYYRKSEDTYQDYEDRGLRNDSLYSDYETQSNQAMAASLVAAGIWVYSIIDAYVVAKNAQSQTQSRKNEPSMRLAAAPDRIGIVYRKRF